MATAPASGIRLKASTVSVCEIDCDKPRAIWANGLRVPKTERPVIGSITAAQTTSEDSDRRNITSPTG